MGSVIVFDLGGTLMEYEGMPLSWLSYYPVGFAAVNAAFSLGLTEDEISRSVQVLKEYNPRYSPREVEISPEKIFGNAVCHWSRKVPVEQVIPVFFQGMELSPRIYGDTLPTLSALKKAGFPTACLTNLPSGMPDSLFRQGISQLVEALDLYVSSGTCGLRKPNPAGLEQIAGHFGLPVEELLFVGDEKLDVDTAKRAGLLDRAGAGPSWGQDETAGSLDQLFSPGLLA